jgi:hypothetical protein
LYTAGVGVAIAFADRDVLLTSKMLLVLQARPQNFSYTTILSYFPNLIKLTFLQKKKM